MAKNAHDLKQLQVRLAKAEAEAGAAKEEVRAAQKREAEAAKLVASLRQQVEEYQAKGGEPMVTEHALLRYFERVLGYDLEEIRGMILNDTTRAYIEQFGSGKIPGKGFRIVVKDRAVVTVEAA